MHIFGIGYIGVSSQVFEIVCLGLVTRGLLGYHRFSPCGWNSFLTPSVLTGMPSFQLSIKYRFLSLALGKGYRTKVIFHRSGKKGAKWYTSKHATNGQSANCVEQ